MALASSCRAVLGGLTGRSQNRSLRKRQHVLAAQTNTTNTTPIATARPPLTRARSDPRSHPREKTPAQLAAKFCRPLLRARSRSQSLAAVRTSLKINQRRGRTRGSGGRPVSGKRWPSTRGKKWAKNVSYTISSAVNLMHIIECRTRALRDVTSH